MPTFTIQNSGINDKNIISEFRFNDIGPELGASKPFIQKFIAQLNKKFVLIDYPDSGAWIKFFTKNFGVIK